VPVAAAEDRLPRLLRIVEHERHEVDHALFFGRRGPGGRRRGRGRRVGIAAFVEHGQKVLSRDEAEDDEDRKPAEADGRDAAESAAAESRALASTIFDVGAASPR
jgi:hypothetical protein